VILQFITFSFISEAEESLKETANFRNNLSWKDSLEIFILHKYLRIFRHEEG